MSSLEALTPGRDAGGGAGAFETKRARPVRAGARRRRAVRVVSLPLSLPLLAAVLLGLTAPACSLGGESGVAPPLNRIFLPTGLSVSSSGRWMAVVNSNSDLRYSFGTVLPLDLDAAEKDRAESWQDCPAVDFRPREPEKSYCCRDLLDRRVLNCDERPYARSSQTVRIGSFGTEPTVQRFVRSGQVVDRLFFGVRADPSITFVDLTEEGDQISLRCSGPVNGAEAPRANARCDETYRVETGTLEGQSVNLPEEPYSLLFNPSLGVLYVGHLFGGLSALDVCGPGDGRVPRLAAVLRGVYGGENSTGVTSVTLARPSDPAAPVFATARQGFNLGQVVFRSPASASACTEGRDLTLVASAPTAAAAFIPRGSETRGLVFQPERQRAFILHRNSGGNPAALVRADISDAGAGRFTFRPTETIDVCSGPAQLALHDGGRGARLYVPCFDSGQIYVVDPDLMVVTNIVETGRGPASVTFDPSDPGLAYVVGFIDNNVSVLDLRPGSPTELRIIQRIGFPRTSNQL